jgi:hypothetical protein
VRLSRMSVSFSVSAKVSSGFLFEWFVDLVRKVGAFLLKELERFFIRQNPQTGFPFHSPR